MKFPSLLCALAALSLPAGAAPVAVNGSMHYTQDFNALSNTPNNDLSATNWDDDTTIPGWFLYRAGNGTAAGSVKGFAGMAFPYRVTDGNIQTGQANGLMNTGWYYSMGNDAGINRAIGVVPITAQGELSYLAVFQNTGGVPIRLTHIAYNAEVWRTNQDASTIETVAVWWKKAATQAELINMTTGPATVADWPVIVATTPTSHYVTGWNRVANADFTYNSTVANTRGYETFPVSAAPASQIEILPGEFFSLRWGNINDRGADALMGIDDVDLTFTAADIAVTGAASNVVRSDAGTPREPADDTVSFDLTVNGTGAVSAGWKVSAPAAVATVTGTYGVPVSVSGVPISAFTGASHVLTMTVEDQGNASINTIVQAVAPWTQITSVTASDFLYDNKGTASAADDEVRYQLKADGVFTGASYSAGAAGSAPYGTALTLTAPAPGTYTTHIITDSADPATTTSLTVFPPAIIGTNATTLSPVPLLSQPVAQNGAIHWTMNGAARTLQQKTSTLQADHVILSQIADLSAVGDLEFTATLVADTIGGTSGFETNDSFALELIINGAPPVSALGTSDTDGDGRLTGGVELSAVAGATGTFTFSYPVPAAASSVQVRITGNSNSPNESFTVSNLQVAIPQPEITLSAASNIVRNPNGPGAADDTVSFEVTISGTNGGTGWVTTGTTPASGNFGVATLTVPAGGNAVTVRITDNTYPNAFADITIPLPGPYIIGSLDLGAGIVPVFTDETMPPADAWVINAAERSMSMTDGDVVIAGDKVVTSEVISLAGAAGAVNFSANLHITDRSAGYEAADNFLLELILNGDTGSPIRVTDLYDLDFTGRMNGSELCPVPIINPTLQNYDYPLNAVIPAGTTTVQIIITGTNDSPNETMILSGISLSQGAPDADGDGMSDAYEDANGLNKNSDADRNLDPDNDGQTNHQEFQAGTAANDAASLLRITDGTSNIATGEINLTWTSVAGKRYRLQTSGDLATWTDAGATVTATGATTSGSFTIPGAPLTGKGFLRVKVVQ